MRPKYQMEISDRISHLKYGSAFTATDFADVADVDAINKALSRMCKDKQIRRVMQGVYDKPEYSVFLQEYSVPRIDLIAEALARKYNWTIAPSGDTALNMLHLSTQVPNSWTYISDGPGKKYKIGNTILILKKCANKEISGRKRITLLVIQALKAIGKGNLSDENIVKLKAELSDEDKRLLMEEGRTATSWIYQGIKKICQEDADA